MCKQLWDLHGMETAKALDGISVLEHDSKREDVPHGDHAHALQRRPQNKD